MKDKKALVFGETKGLDNTSDQSNSKPNQFSSQEIQHNQCFGTAELSVMKKREMQTERRWHDELSGGDYIL